MVKENQPVDKKLAFSLIETLNSTGLPEISKDLGEVALDSVLDSGVLKDVPIINTIVGLSKTAISIRDRILIQKILSFLKGIKDITNEEREKFSKDIESDPKYKQRVGEHLIVLLDRLDDLNKPEMITKLFRAYLRDDIAYREFVRFSSIVDRAFINDLSGFLTILSEDTPRMRNPYVTRLYHLGLSEIVFDDSAYQKVKTGIDTMTLGTMAKFFGDDQPLQFRVTEEACVLAQIILGKNIYGVNHVEKYKISRELRIE